jgi:4'-phosphopantetheinyl transferase
VHGWHTILERLDSSQIRLWLAFPDDVTEPPLLDEYRQLLSPEELRRHQRFHFERDRHRFLVTRAMVRTVLSKYAEAPPRDWRFDVNVWGRPSIARGHGPASGIDFNVSHADGIVVLAVALGRVVGVDVENVRTQRVDIEIADRYFAAAEVRALRALPREQQQRRFFAYWTLKESYIKARGAGLSIPLDRFAFDLEDSARITLTVDLSLRDSAERWACWQVQLGDDYLAAVCAEQHSGVQLALSSPHLWPESNTRRVAVSISS